MWRQWKWDGIKYQNLEWPGKKFWLYLLISWVLKENIMYWNAFEKMKAFPENCTRRLQDCVTERMEGGVRKFMSDPKEITLDAVVNNTLAAIHVISIAWETELKWKSSRNIYWRKMKKFLRMMGGKKTSTREEFSWKSQILQTGRILLKLSDTFIKDTCAGSFLSHCSM